MAGRRFPRRADPAVRSLRLMDCGHACCLSLFRGSRDTGSRTSAGRPAAEAVPGVPEAPPAARRVLGLPVRGGPGACEPRRGRLTGRHNKHPNLSVVIFSRERIARDGKRPRTW
ncbi:hypothetical protein GCM10010517_65230 [Streptosporangium fragile]|uniref:Uncharacterized protein n=1 Tax=Streptosporangium fragile TaxID=46186 RepID=A0ABN3W5S8_9ACTN